MKTLFLLSHTPIPRFLKRIHVAKKQGNTKVIYWDRLLQNDIKFTLPNEVECESIKLKAPQGKPLKRSLLLMYFSILSIIRIAKYKPDNIHVGNFDMLFIACMYKIFLNKNLNIIYEIGDLPELVFKKNLIAKLFIKLEKKLLKQVNSVILTSPYFLHEYYKKITEERKCYFIPNVPFKNILTNTLKNKSKSKKEHLNSKLKIGFIGSIRYETQIKMLIDIIRDKNNIEFIISGTGKNIKNIKDYSSENKNVIFTGAYNYNEINRLYGNIDLVYSVYDTNKKNVKVALPNRLYEAIVFEKPLIVSKNTELANFVKSNGIGYAVSDTKKEDLEELILDISKSNNQLLEKSRNCKKIKQEYFYEEYIPVLEMLYKK